MQKPLLSIVSTPWLALVLVVGNQIAPASSAPNPATPALAQDSSAQSTQVTVSGTHRTYACHNPGDSIQVTGNSDILTITGNCGSLQVTGRSNTITIDSVATVQFTGDSNSVLYRSAHRPTVGDQGQSNSVARTSAQSTASHGNAGSTDNDTAAPSRRKWLDDGE